MKKKLLFLFVSAFLLLNSVSACDIVLTLTDTYGDGWNGNSLTVTVNGTVVLDAVTIADGSGPEVFTFAANTGDDVVITYDNSGAYDYENEYTITMPWGEVTQQIGLNGTDPISIDFGVNCTPCQDFTTQLTTTPASLINVCPEDVILFSSSGTYPNDGVNYTQSDALSIFTWDFGDGNTLVGSDVSYTYSNTGAFTAELTVTDTNNCSVTSSIDVQINCQDIDPVIASSSNAITNFVLSACLGTQVTFEGLTTYLDNNNCYTQTDANSTFTWDFDGTVVDDQNASHTFNSNGSFPVNLTVTDQYGCSYAAQTVTVEVVCQEIDPSISSSSNTITNFVLSACLGTQVNFEGLATYPQNNLCYTQSDANSTFQWNINGANVSGENANYTFNSNGSFPVNLTVTDQFGCSYIAQTVTVQVGCQPIDIDINSDVQIVNDTLFACPDVEFNLDAVVTYPQDGVCYSQSNSTSTFAWDFGDGNAVNGLSATQLYENPGLYEVSLTVTDVNGCVQTDDFIVFIYLDPNFPNTFADVDTICLGDQINLTGSATPNVPEFIPDTIFLPDDPDGFYQSDLTYTIFAPGATFTNVNDLISVCLNIEHSWVNDLEIQLICPNGQSVHLLSNPNDCSNHFLGEPVDVDSEPDAVGVGYEYCWSPTSTNGTFTDNIDNYQYTYTDALGNVETNQDYFPAGDYEPDDSFSDLIGCPMNGQWSIYVNDHLSSDNGFLFSWALNLNLPNFLPPDDVVFPPADQVWYSDDLTDNFIVNANGDATVMPGSTGLHTYTYHVESLYGCGYDTVVGPVFVAPNPVIDAGVDASVCGFDYVLNATISEGTGQWSHVGPGNVTYTDVNSPSTEVVVDQLGTYIFSFTPNTIPLCQNPNDVEVEFHAIPTSDFTLTDIDCYGDPSIINYIGSSTSTDGFNYTYGGGNVVGNEVSWTSVGNHEVSLTIEQDGCVSETTTQTVYNPEELKILSIAKEDVNCFGGSDGVINVNVTGGILPYSYNYLPGLINSNIISAVSAGDYLVTVTDVNGCQTNGAVTISEPDPYKVEFFTEDVSCYGESDGKIDLEVSGNTSPYAYNWSNNYTTPNISGLIAGEYSITITDSKGCKYESLVEVAEPEELVLTVEASVNPICKNGTSVIMAATTGGVPLSGASGYSYSWSTGSTLDFVDVSPMFDESYSVTVTDKNDCKKNDDIIIEVYDVLSLAIDDYTDSICLGDEAIINTSYSGGNLGPYTLQVNSGEYINDPYIFIPKEVGTFTYTITLDDLCSTTPVSVPVTITVKPLPEGEIISDIPGGCQPCNVEFNFNPTNGQAIDDYVWTFNDDLNNYSSIGVPTHTFENSGIYDVSVVVVSENKCKNTFTRENFITVYPNPIANFVADPMVTTILDPIIYFENNSELNHVNAWSFGDGTSSDLSSLEHIYEKPGVYSVTLEVTTDHECKDKISGEVVIKDEYTFYAPTAFVPQISGYNNKFYVQGEGIDKDNFEMIVFNRWGEIIYETKIYNEDDPKSNGWDGRAKNGKYVETGVYEWSVKFIDKRGNHHFEHGTVTVLR